MKLKQVITVSLCSMILAACGSGSSARQEVSSASYGQVMGSNVKYNGKFTPLYRIPELQKFIVTDTSIVADLGGVKSFGVCNSIESNAFGKNLCELNKHTLKNSPKLSTLFPDKSGINTNNFVTAGALKLGITFIQPYRILYSTAGAPYQFSNGGTMTETVSAAVLMPETNDGPLPASKIKGVVLFFHGTVVSKGGVPSDFTGDLTPNNSSSGIYSNSLNAFIQDATLSAIFASQGYIVIVPDYLGQGVSYQLQHPYVILPQTNAQSGLNALKAARIALAAESIVLPSPAKLYISSYSEGGAYALWASKLAQTSYAGFLAENNYALERTIGASGVYDLTGASLHYEFANAISSSDPMTNVWNVSPGLVSGNSIIDESYVPIVRALVGLELAASKTALAGYVLTALAYYNSSPTSLDVLAPNFAPMKNCLSWELSTFSGIYPAVPGNTPTAQAIVSCPLNYDLAALFNTSGLSSTEILDQSFAAADAASAGENAFLTGGMTFQNLFFSLESGLSNNSLSGFVNPGVLDDPTIITPLIPQNIFSWSTNSPIDLLFLNYDSVVSNINSLEACGNMPDFPGYQPANPVKGLKQLSADGLVNCINLPNNGESGLSTVLYTEAGSLPLMIDHGQAEVFLQLLALNQIIANQ